MSSETSTFINDDMATAEDSSLTIIRTVVLLLLLLISLVGNSLVIFAIAVSSKRAQTPFNAYLLSMAAFGLLECALTISLATGFSLEGEWLFGDFLKGFNACFIQLQNIGVMLTVAAMTVDRYLSVSGPLKYRKESSVHRANYAVLYTWIHAFIVSLPLLFHNENLGLTVREYVERCLCGLSEGTTIIYTIILIGTSYAAPFILSIIYIIIVFVKSAKERKEMRTENTANYASYCLQESQLLLQARSARYVLMLFFLYLLFKVPYVCIDLLTQFGTEGAYIAINGTGNSTTSDLPSGSKFYYQTSISWLMFCFSAMYPIVTFAWFAEHRKRIRMHLCCGKERISLTKGGTRNKVQGQTARLPDRPRRPHGKNRVYGRGPAAGANNRQKVVKAPSSVASIGTTKDKAGTSNKLPEGGPSKGFRVPVLYAAADGLHLLASNKTHNKDPALLKAPPKSISSEQPSSSTDADSPRPSATSEGENAVSTPSSSRKVTRNWLTLNPSELLKRFKKGSQASSVGATDEQNSAEVSPPGTQVDRPSSVIDKRVDVLGSTDCLQPEEESYFRYTSSDFEDETESELNESANSRTLILPSRHIATAPVKKARRGRAAAISPLPPLKGSKPGFLEDQRSQSVIENPKGVCDASQNVKEIFVRSRTPSFSNCNMTSPDKEDFVNTSRRFASNPALRQNIDDISSIRSNSSTHSVRFESDTISLSSTIRLCDNNRSKDVTEASVNRIFIPKKGNVKSKEGGVKDDVYNADIRLHAPSEDDRRVADLRKMFSPAGSLHSFNPSTPHSRPGTPDRKTDGVDAQNFPPLSDNMKPYLTSQKFR